MLAYNERILTTSQSRQRRNRAARMIANLQPILARFAHTAQVVLASPKPAPIDDRFESVWDGRSSLRDLHQTLHPELNTDDVFDRVAQGEPYDHADRD